MLIRFIKQKKTITKQHHLSSMLNEYNNHRDDAGFSWNDPWVHQGGVVPGYYHGRTGRYAKKAKNYYTITEEDRKLARIVLEEYKKITS